MISVPPEGAEIKQAAGKFPAVCGRREAALLVSFGTKENPFGYGKEESCERNPGGVPFALNPSFPSRRKGRKANRLPENFRQPAAAERRPFLCRLSRVLVKGVPAV